MRSTLEEVVSYLASTLSVPVSSEAPADRPDVYVLVDPVGGTPSLDALHQDYALQAWATDYATAEATIRDVCDAMVAYGATCFALPVPLGYDGIYRWWQATFTVHALW